MPRTTLQCKQSLLAGDKPFNCDICQKKFALSCNLRAHLKTHEAEYQSSAASLALYHRALAVLGSQSPSNESCSNEEEELEEEEEESIGKGLSGSSGIGGTVGGKFQGFFIGQPPCERRRATLGVGGPDGDGGGQDHSIGGGFGWIDFLGVGSERAVGPRMRRLEHRLLRQLLPPTAGTITSSGRERVVILGELNLDW